MKNEPGQVAAHQEGRMTQEPRNLRKPPAKDDRSGASPEPEGGEPKNAKGPQPPPAVKLSRSLMSWVVVIALLIMIFVVLNVNKPGVQIDTWKTFVTYI